MERILIRSQDLLQGIPAEVSDRQIGEGYTAVVLSADAQATVEALQAQYSELLEALDCVLAERPLPSGEYVHRVSCNGDRRKPAGTVGISCSCRVGQQQVEALQREVKLQKEGGLRERKVADSYHQDLVKCEAALEAERERSKKQAEEAMLVFSKLSQLQALVRALVCTMGYVVDGSYILTRGGVVLYACSSSISAERLGAVLAYRATLPATPTEEAT